MSLVLSLSLLASPSLLTLEEIKALPDRRSQLVWTRGMSLSLLDPPCKTADDCKDKSMKQPECVEQTGGDWSQCVDCDATAFQSSCKYWSPALLAPAEAACNLNCTGKAPPGPPPTLACHKDADCKDPTKPSCVVQADGNYAQCISCDTTPFQAACPSWEKVKFLPAAEAKCGEKCTGQGPPPPPPPTLACRTDADCKDPTHPSCVVQADGNYAQCITCEEHQFHLDCKDWEKTKFLPAAEAKCSETC